MWYLVLIAVAVVIIVVVLAYSNSGRPSSPGSPRHQSDDTPARMPNPEDEGHNLHHDSDGTPYGAMDAEFDAG